jgi:uncharacterized membrane protein
VNELRSVRTRFSRKDAAEISIGCCVMAFPAATTEEIWKLGETLSTGRVLLFAAASMFFLALLMYQLHHGADVQSDHRDFWLRALSTYGLTLAISALILFGVDRLELLVNPLVGIKRTILVAFPASFAATVVDSLR